MGASVLCPTLSGASGEYWVALASLRGNVRQEAMAWRLLGSAERLRKWRISEVSGARRRRRLPAVVLGILLIVFSIAAEFPYSRGEPDR